MSTRIIEGFGSCPLQQPSFVPGGLLGDNASTASGQLSHSTVPQGPDIAKGWDAFSGEGVNLCFTVKPETSDEPDIGNVINNFFGGGTGRSSGTGAAAPTGSTPTGGQTTHRGNVIHPNVLATAWESSACPTNTPTGAAYYFNKCIDGNSSGCPIMYTAAGPNAPASMWKREYLKCPVSTIGNRDIQGTPGENFTCLYDGNVGCPVQGQGEASPAWKLSVTSTGKKRCTSEGTSLPEGTYRWADAQAAGCPAWVAPSGQSPGHSSVTAGCTSGGFYGDATMPNASATGTCYPQEACKTAYGWTATAGNKKPVGHFVPNKNARLAGQCNACGGTFDNATCGGQTGWYDVAGATCRSIDLGVGSNSSSNICQKCYIGKGALRAGTPTSPPECLPCGEMPGGNATQVLSYWNPPSRYADSGFWASGGLGVPGDLELGEVCKSLTQGGGGKLVCPPTGNGVASAATDFEMVVPKCNGDVVNPYDGKTLPSPAAGITGFATLARRISSSSAAEADKTSTASGYYYGPGCDATGWIRPGGETAQYSIDCEPPKTCGSSGEYYDAASGKCVPCHKDGAPKSGYTYTGSTQGGLCPQGSGDQEPCMFKVNNGTPDGGENAITIDGTNQCVKLDRAGAQSSQFVIPIADQVTDATTATRFQYAYLANNAGYAQAGNAGNETDYEGVWKPTDTPKEPSSCPSYYLKPAMATPQPIYKPSTTGTFASNFMSEMTNNKSLPAPLRAELAGGGGFGPKPAPTTNYTLCTPCPEGEEIRYEKASGGNALSAQCVPAQGGTCPYMVGACPAGANSDAGCANDVYTCCDGLTSTPAVSHASLGTGYFQAVYKGSTQYKAAENSATTSLTSTLPTSTYSVPVSNPGSTNACWAAVADKTKLSDFYGCVMWTESGGDKSYTLPPPGRAGVELAGDASVKCTFSVAPATSGTCADAGSFPIMSSISSGNVQTYCGACPTGTIYKGTAAGCKATDGVITMETANDCCVPCPTGMAFMHNGNGGTCVESSDCRIEFAALGKNAGYSTSLVPGYVSLSEKSASGFDTPVSATQAIPAWTAARLPANASSYWQNTKEAGGRGFGSGAPVCAVCPEATQSEIVDWIKGNNTQMTSSKMSNLSAAVGGWADGGSVCKELGYQSDGVYYKDCPWQKYNSFSGCTLCATPRSVGSMDEGNSRPAYGEAGVEYVPDLTGGACGTCEYQIETFTNRGETEAFTVQGL